MIVSRRKLIGLGAAGAGGLLLGGCDRLNRAAPFRDGLIGAEGLTMRAQRLLVGDALAREYAERDMSPDFRTNGSTSVADAGYRGHLAQGFARWSLRVDGLVRQPLSLSLDALKALPQRSQITRHDCVEGWSAIGKWQGPQLSTVLARAGLLPSARYVVFHCADLLDGEPYYESIDLIDAFHPQTICAYGLNGQQLPVENGAPIRVRNERALGYKQPKYVHTIDVVDGFSTVGLGQGGYWEDHGYDWYGGI